MLSASASRPRATLCDIGSCYRGVFRERLLQSWSICKRAFCFGVDPLNGRSYTRQFGQQKRRYPKAAPVKFNSVYAAQESSRAAFREADMRSLRSVSRLCKNASLLFTNFLNDPAGLPQVSSMVFAFICFGCSGCLSLQPTPLLSAN